MAFLKQRNLTVVDATLCSGDCLFDNVAHQLQRLGLDTKPGSVAASLPRHSSSGRGGGRITAAALRGTLCTFAERHPFLWLPGAEMTVADVVERYLKEENVDVRRLAEAQPARRPATRAAHGAQQSATATSAAQQQRQPVAFLKLLMEKVHMRISLSL